MKRRGWEECDFVYITGDAYEIVRWKLVSTTEWEEDDSVDVWNGSLK